MKIRMQFRRYVSLVCTFVLLFGTGLLQADEKAPFSVYNLDPKLNSLMYVCGADTKPQAVWQYNGEDKELTFVWYQSVNGKWEEVQSQTEPVKHGMLLSVYCPKETLPSTSAEAETEIEKEENIARKYLIRLADDNIKMELSFEPPAPSLELTSVVTSFWDGNTWIKNSDKGMPVFSLAAGKDTVNSLNLDQLLENEPLNPYNLVLAVKVGSPYEAKDN